MSGRCCWIAVAPQDLVLRAQAAGYAQLASGRARPLERIAAGDGFVYYSPRSADPLGPRLQAFTASGRVESQALVQVADDTGRPAFRRPIEYHTSVPAAIHPLPESLGFTRGKKHRGAAFRFGTLRIPGEDFQLIATAMGCPDMPGR